MLDIESNDLIDGLGQFEYERISKHLELVQLHIGDQLTSTGRIIQDVYFPTTSLISVTIDLSDGYSADAAFIGKDSMVGIGVLGNDISFCTTNVRMPGYALKMPVTALWEEFKRHSELTQYILIASRKLIFQTAQNSICKRHHSIHQQFIRWILETFDKINVDHLQITHEQIAAILGVRREAISLCAKKLSDTGLISYPRGNLRLLDKGGLLAQCCECYTTVKTNCSSNAALHPAAEIIRYNRTVSIGTAQPDRTAPRH